MYIYIKKRKKKNNEKKEIKARKKENTIHTIYATYLQMFETSSERKKVRKISLVHQRLLSVDQVLLRPFCMYIYIFFFFSFFIFNFSFLRSYRHRDASDISVLTQRD